MTTSRRSVLKGLAVAGVGASGWALLAGGHSFGRPSAFSTPLRVPPLDEGTSRDGVRVFDLGVQAGKTEFVSGRVTPTIGANGSFLGPVLRFKSGDRVAINVTNKLDVDTTLHWHGLHVPAAADGGPHQVIKPGATWSPSFEIRQQAGLFWYHSHMMERTGEQVNSGLAGPIIADDTASSSLGLPNEYGVDDFSIAILARLGRVGAGQMRQLGDPLTHRTDQDCRTNHPPSSRWHLGLVRQSHRQRADRRHQQSRASRQSQGAR